MTLLSPRTFRAALTRVPAPILLLLGIVALHTGSALAVLQFDAMSAAGITWLRLSWAALLLLAMGGRSLWARVRAASAKELRSVVILGTVTGGMMTFYSEATARIDLGTATSLEFLGPLAVGVLAMRRRRELVWIAAAVTGVVCMTRPWAGDADLAGVGFGLGGAVCVAFYIILAQRVGGSFGALHGLALSLTVSALVTAPVGLPDVAADPDPAVIASMLGVALLFPLVPFLLEMVALQRMSRTAYSTFAGLEPAVSLVVGVIVIAQVPVAVQLAGMALVVVAGIGAARSERRAVPPAPAGPVRAAEAPERGEPEARAAVPAPVESGRRPSARRPGRREVPRRRHGLGRGARRVREPVDAGAPGA